MLLFDLVNELQNYYRLKQIQQALEHLILQLPLKTHTYKPYCTTESFAKDSVTLYVTTEKESEPCLTIRCYKNTALISVKIDPFSPHQDEALNTPLLSDTYDAITNILPEGKVVGMSMESGTIGCYFLTSISRPDVSSISSLFKRMQGYFTQAEVVRCYQDYQNQDDNLVNT